MSLVEQELRTLPEHMSSLSIFSWVRIAQSLVFCVMFCGSLFVLFLLAIVLSVFLRITASDYPFDIFELFSWYKVENKSYWDNTHSLGIDLQNSKCLHDKYVVPTLTISFCAQVTSQRLIDKSIRYWNSTLKPYLFSDDTYVRGNSGQS